MIFFKKNCIAETSGKIVKVHFFDDTRRLTVEYTVDGARYVLKENVTVKSTAVKVGGIPFGQRQTECIKEGVGDTVAVKYDPRHPNRAYLKDNIGKHR